MAAGSVDLTVTSPPYDDVRDFGPPWDWRVWREVEAGLRRVTAVGGVLVLVLQDRLVDGGESGSAFRMALYCMEAGWTLHGTFVWDVMTPPPCAGALDTFARCHHYMFVLCIGRRPRTVHVRRVGTVGEGTRVSSHGSGRKPSGVRGLGRGHVVAADKREGNVWRMRVGNQHTTDFKDAHAHPAIFPDELARRHIAAWSDAGDLIYDPMAGSGTVPAMALSMGRRWIASEAVARYADIARRRIAATTRPLFGEGG